MTFEQVGDFVEVFAAYAMFALIAIVGFLVVLGVVNAVIVIWRTLASPRARHEHNASDGPLPEGIISMYTYLHLLADVLLVVVAIELIETFLAFERREDPRAYLTGVIGAALVALARRIIVFFNPEAEEAQTGEMYAYAALVVALAAAYAVITYL
ncbi:MAG: phosphate-starvation-inducible PsiE family protein [Actinomycetota bacterium]|nr:phosphate-starvation-inducible PsiE family protein [Actinomycetota bacterium]MDZ4178835.1 phosphate-starvation-inducible PsiE family protein [Coriobacteriia bacterium]